MSVLSFYLCAHVLLAGLVVADRALARGFDGARLSWASRLRFHQAGVLTVVLISVSVAFVPRPDIFTPILKVESRPDRPLAAAAAPVAAFARVGKEDAVRFGEATPWLSLGALALVGSLWFGLTALLALLRIGRDVRRLRRLARGAFVTRSFGRVAIAVTDRVAAPCSWWSGRHLWIFVPPFALGARDRVKMSVLHELRHHRQGDTVWVYAVELFSWVFAGNPLFKVWKKENEALQEYACDEAVVDRGNVKPRDYALALYEMAAESLNRPRPFVRMPVGTTGFLGGNGRGTLIRRIEMIGQQKRTRKGIRLLALVGASLAISGTALGLASRDWVQDYRFTEKEALVWTANAARTSTIPVELNERTLKWLRYFVGTTEGRQRMRTALANMERYKEMIRGKISDYGGPEELLAVPIVESGYRNLPQDMNSATSAAGLWQFIPSSARLYGMRVDEKVDERLNEEIETDAGIRYLVGERLRFNDWRLALMSYNMGERALQRGINRVGSRDAWTLIRAGVEGDRDYLAKVIAAIVVLKNPEIVKE